MKKHLWIWLFLLASLLILPGVGMRSVPVSARPLIEQAVYSDTLAAPWQDWSWGSRQVNFSSTNPVHSGSAAISVQLTEGWSGLQFGANSPVDISVYEEVRFMIHGGASGGQSLLVRVGSYAHGVYTEQAVTPIANTWTSVTIDLTGLGVTDIDYLWWFNNSAGSIPVFHLDAVYLEGSGTPPPTPVPGAGPALTVDAAAGRHAISPYIYGLNFANEALAAELQLPVNRWGGNATTRYNWQNDISNRASDWYFENIPGETSGLPDSAGYNAFITANQSSSTATILTLPLIGWTPKTSTDILCGFSVSKYGAQQSTDPWRPDCGNGRYPNGSPITGNDPTDTSLAIAPDFVADWVEYLVERYGTAASGGVRFYNLDNEPMLWPDTHRDVHPAPTSYDEMRQRTYEYAAAIKAADPTAKTLGPVVWGWTAYFYSALDWSAGGDWWNHPQDRLAHGDMPFLAWYLEQMADYESDYGVRILDYLDAHYYPQSGVALTGAGDASLQALRLRSTRSLWDPTYQDESWIGEPVNLIPRLQAWIAQYYPGTLLAITEYNWGALDHINGALAQADVLGIFGREGVDLATLWAPPEPDQPGAYAFRMYLNYDGQGSRFGETSVQAVSADSAQLSIFAAERFSDQALTVMVINKTSQTLTSQLVIENYSAAQAAGYRYSNANLDAIQTLTPLVIGPAGLSATYPPNSITLWVIPAAQPVDWQPIFLPLARR